jgi:acyl-CoA thioester hydrolase
VRVEHDALLVTLRVRHSECDQQGVVFNAHYLSYFDVGFTELIRAAFGSPRVPAERGVDFVVAEVNLRYLRPAHFDDELTVESVVSQLGTTSIVTRYRVRRHGELLVEGTVRHVLVDLAKLAAREPSAKTSLPAWMREGLDHWTVDEPHVVSDRLSSR